MTDQAPGFYRRRAGDFVLTALNDGAIDLPLEALSGIAPETATTLLATAFRRPQPHSAINAYLVQGDGRTMLIDTGAGSSFGPACGRLPANLAAAGVSPDDVDLVLLTHLHGDHFGGLTKDGGARAFPRASVMVAQAELDFWLDDARLEAAPEPRKATFLGARKALAAYGDQVHALDAASMPGVTAVALPGHTPGHTGFRVGTGADAVLIWGDVIHVPDVQAAHPEAGMIFDADLDQAIATRRRILAEAADERLAVAGMHLHFPGFCHVARRGGAYELVWDTWDAEP